MVWHLPGVFPGHPSWGGLTRWSGTYQECSQVTPLGVVSQGGLALTRSVPRSPLLGWSHKVVWHLPGVFPGHPSWGGLTRWSGTYQECSQVTPLGVVSQGGLALTRSVPRSPLLGWSHKVVWHLPGVFPGHPSWGGLTRWSGTYQECSQVTPLGVVSQGGLALTRSVPRSPLFFESFFRLERQDWVRGYQSDNLTLTIDLQIL